MVNLLWTGGWDSTFRLLQLAQKGAVIQPYYIKDPQRNSFKKEIQTMAGIREAVNERFTDSCVLEIDIFNQSDIIVDQEFVQARQNLLSRGWIGSQYIYTASYARQRNLKNLELSIELPSQPRHGVMPCLDNTEINEEGYRVISSNADDNILCLFGQFSFPVLELTKMDMLKKSREQGFFDILDTTWFCHHPLRGKPCGTCSPCIQTLEDGLKYRFNTLAQLRYRLKKTLISQPKAYSFLRKLKHLIGTRSYGKH